MNSCLNSLLMTSLMTYLSPLLKGPVMIIETNARRTHERSHISFKDHLWSDIE